MIFALQAGTIYIDNKCTARRKHYGTCHHHRNVQKAYVGGYAVGAFNINNMEIIQAITEAAAELKSPVILQVSTGARKYAKQPYLMALVKAAIEDTGLDLVLHLDHGGAGLEPDAAFEQVKGCVDSGFSSVMIDGSKFPFDVNVALTKRVVDYAHERGVVVEGGAGHTGRN